MKQRLGFVLAVLLALCGTARADQKVPTSQDYQGFHAYHLGSPLTGFDPATSVLRLTDVNPGGSPCALASPGSLGVPTCLTLSSLFTPDPPLVFGGSGGTHLILTQDGTSIGTSGGALQRLALTMTGPVTGTFAAGAATAATAINLAGGSISSTLQAANFPAMTGAVVSAGGTLATTFGTQAGISLFGVAGSSTAVPAPIIASGAGVQAPLYNGTAIAWGVVPGASVRADGIVTGTVQLASLASASLADGTIAYVDTVGDYFALTQTALTTTPTTVITASGKSGYQWVRLGILNHNWEARTAWFIDPQNSSATANDENTGLTSSVPLLSWAEVSRRLQGAQITNVSGVVFTAMSDGNTTDDVTMDVQIGQRTGLTVTGVPAVIYTGTVTAFTNAATGPAADDIELNDASIPTSYTASGLLADGLVAQQTTTANRWFFIAKDLGSKTARISVPGSLGGAAQTLTNGSTYTVSRLPKIYGLRWPHMTGLSTSVGHLQYNLIWDMSPDLSWQQAVYSRCWRGTASDTEDNFALSNSAIGTGLTSNFRIGKAQANFSLGLSRSNVLFEGIQTLMSGFIFQGVNLQIARSSLVAVNGRVSFYDTSSIAMLITDASRLGFSGTGSLSGSGNSGPLISTARGGQAFYTATPVVAGSTSSGTPIQVNGINYAVSALPVNVGVGGEGVFLTDTPGDFLTDPGANGLVARTGLYSSAARTLTSSTLTVTNGTGVSGNPNVELPTLVTGLPSPTGTGFSHVTSGAWDAAARAVNLSGADVTSQLPLTALAQGGAASTNLLAWSGTAWAPTAAGVPTTRTFTMTAPMTCDGGGSCDLSANRTIATPVFAGSAAGLVPASAGGTTNFLRADGTYAVPAGTGGAGTVTSVNGTAGQILCTPSSPNPVCSLVAKGAGAGAYGGSGIAGFSLDAFGAVTAVTPATYLTSAGTTPGTFNSVAVASSGLVTSGSATSWVASGILKSAGLSAVPAAATSGDIATVLGMPAATQVLVSNSTTTAPVGDSNFTYNTTTHTLSTGNVILSGSVTGTGFTGLGNTLLGVDNSGNFNQVSVGSGLTFASGILSVTPGQNSKLSFCAYNTSGIINQTYGQDASCNVGNAVYVPEWPDDFLASNITINWNLQVNALSGTLVCEATRNGVGISSSAFTFTSGTLLGFKTTSTTTGSSSFSDTYGLECTLSGSSGSTYLVTAEMLLYTP